jgi:hypothetical protein
VYSHPYIIVPHLALRYAGKEDNGYKSSPTITRFVERGVEKMGHFFYSPLNKSCNEKGLFLFIKNQRR